MKRYFSYLLITTIVLSLLTSCSSTKRVGDKVDEQTKGSISSAANNSPSVLSQEQAADNGGYYIKRGDDFYPLAKGAFATDYTNSADDTYIASTAQIIPRLSDGDELVLFSSYSITSAVIRQSFYHGYTLPIFFYIAYDGAEVPLVYADPDILEANLENIQEHCTSNEEWEQLQKFFDEVSYGGNTLLAVDEDGELELSANFVDDGEFWLADNDYGCSAGMEVEKDTFAEIGYQKGSAWNHVTVPACIEFWAFEPTGSTQVQTTRMGYYTFDTSEWDRGTYVIYVGMPESGNESWGYASGSTSFYFDTALFFEIQ